MTPVSLPNANEFFNSLLKVLEGAVAIGRQADTLGVHEARTRLETVQSRASSAASVADSAIFAKVKSWLERKKQTEPL